MKAEPFSLTQMNVAAKRYAIRDDLLLSPFEGRAGDLSYLVTAGGTRHLISSKIAAILKAMSTVPRTALEICDAVETPKVDVSEIAGILERLPSEWQPGGGIAQPAVPLFWKRRLISAAVTTRMAGWFSKAVSPVSFSIFLVALIITGPEIAAQLQQVQSQTLTLPIAMLVIAMLSLSVVFHELGHAAATVRFGAKCGEIGIGIYLLYPSLYTDVSGAWNLTRSKRCLVDLCGIYFQTMLLIMVALAQKYMHSPALSWFIYLTLLAFIQTLNPFLKMDGYWLLSDALGIPNLHARMATVCKGLFRGDFHIAENKERVFLAVYALACVMFSLLFVSMLVRMCVYAFRHVFHPLMTLGGDIARLQLSAFMHDAQALLFRDGSGIFVVGLLAVVFAQVIQMVLRLQNSSIRSAK